MAETRRVYLGDVSVDEGEMVACRADEVDVLLCRVNGQLHAIEDRCSHAESTLSEGFLEGVYVTCPLHFAQFDVRTGRHLGPPAFTGVRCFKAHEHGGAIVVDLPSAATTEEGPVPPPGGFLTR
jgi:nitrite reductase/ring-hydroxylating ferredoxin subunit